MIKEVFCVCVCVYACRCVANLTHQKIEELQLFWDFKWEIQTWYKGWIHFVNQTGNITVDFVLVSESLLNSFWKWNY